MRRWDSNVSTLTGIRPYKRNATLNFKKSTKEVSRNPTKRKAPLPPPGKIEEELSQEKMK